MTHNDTSRVDQPGGHVPKAQKSPTPADQTEEEPRPSVRRARRRRPRSPYPISLDDAHGPVSNNLGLGGA